ncbi:hypothetical protein JOB18_049520 [Solea senegalensis]|uniref:Uncharacterized protein n=1 Tax=Solea senegalensis TaxID=28829 RepID=A0AAV6PYC3_SOLSE|nr:hypothetical protein JOB18_049520 [Solea senegalensis]
MGKGNDGEGSEKKGKGSKRERAAEFSVRRHTAVDSFHTSPMGFLHFVSELLLSRRGNPILQRETVRVDSSQSKLLTCMWPKEITAGDSN